MFWFPAYTTNTDLIVREDLLSNPLNLLIADIFLVSILLVIISLAADLCFDFLQRVLMFLNFIIKRVPLFLH